MVSHRFLLLGLLVAVVAHGEERQEGLVQDEELLADPCAAHNTSCASCVEDDRCGWCSASQRCISGGLRSPKLGNCPPGFWSFAFCQDAPCASYSMCTSCLGDAFCGWCTEQRGDDGSLLQPARCMEGKAAGPSGEELCQGEWVFSPVTQGLTVEKTRELDLQHLAALRDTCVAAGFDRLGVGDVPDREEPAQRPPVVLAVSPDVGPDFGHTVVTITGSYFEDDRPGAVEQPFRVFIGGLECLAVERKSASVATCTTPPRPRGMRLENLLVEVRVGNLTSNATEELPHERAEAPASREFTESASAHSRFTYGQMDVLSVSPDSGDTEGGSTITVHGQHFGPKDYGAKISVGGRPCLASTYVSSTELRCVVPPGTGQLLDVRVELLDYAAVSQTNQMFSYNPPVVESVQPSVVPTVGNVEVFVRGKNFGSNAVAPSVLLDGVPCLRTVRVSHRLLRCVVPPGFGTERVVAVTVPNELPLDAPSAAMHGRPSIQTHVRLSFEGPTVESVTPAHGPAEGGNVIVIRGSNLGSGLPQSVPALLPHEPLSKQQGAAWEHLTDVLEDSNLNPTVGDYAKSLLWSMDVPSSWGATGAAGATGMSIDSDYDDEQVEDSMPLASGVATDGSVDPQRVRTLFCETCTMARCDHPQCSSMCPDQCGVFDAQDAALQQELAGVAENQLHLMQQQLDGAGSGAVSALLQFNETVTQRGVAAAAAEYAEGMNWTHSAQPVVDSMQKRSGSLSATGPVDRTVCWPNAPDMTPFGLACLSVTVGGRPCQHVSVVSADELACTVPHNVGRDHDVVVQYANRSSPSHANATYAYDAPVVEQIFPDHGPCIGAVSVTVRGINFGADNYGANASIGGQPCRFTAWMDDKTLECGLPPGMGVEHGVHVQVGGQASAQNVTFTYDEPEIHGVEPARGPTHGGYWLKIHGKNFGPVRHKPGIQVAPHPCMEVKWVSDSLVMCKVPEGHGVNCSVDVEVATQVNEPNTLFSYDGPIVSAVEPALCGTEGGCRLTITGHNFGGHKHHSLAVFVDDVGPCTDVEHVSHTEIKCTAPAGGGKDLNLRVHLAGQDSPPNQRFGYPGPIIDQVFPNHAPTAGGSHVTITGKYFGHSEGMAVATVNGVPCNRTLWHSDSRVDCVVRPGNKWNGRLDVLVNGQGSPQPVRFDYDLPVLARVNPDHVPTEGGVDVELHGSGFADPMRVVFGNASYRYECHTVRVISQHKAVCTVPPGRGAHHAVQLVSSGRRVLQREVGGKRILVSVNMEQSKQGVIDTTEPSVKKSYMEHLSQKLEEAEHASANETDQFGVRWLEESDEQALEIMLLPADGRLHVSLDYDAPVIDSVVPPNGTVMGGTNLTVFGRNFGPPGSQPRVYLDVLRGFEADGDQQVHRALTLCRNTSWISQGKVSCITPSGMSYSRDLVVELDGLRSRPIHAFDYNDPEVYALVPDHGDPAGGYFVRVNGSNFGSVSSEIKAWIGGRQCEKVEWVSNFELRVLVPAGDSDFQEVQVEVAGQKSATVKMFHYDAPEVTSVSPNNRRIHGGKPILIKGANFGGAGNPRRPTASINGVPCLATEWVSGTEVKCTVPPGMGRNLSVVVALGNLRNAPNGLYKYTDVDCVVGDWPDWSACSHPCRGQGPAMGHAWDGPGTTRRGRVIVQPRENYGKACPDLGEERVCSTEWCPVHCEVGAWTPWSSCSLPCHGLGPDAGHEHTGHGISVRTRPVARHPAHGGRHCPPVREERACNTHYCKVDCVMGPWSGWSECDRECRGGGEKLGHSHEGPGQQHRVRHIFRQAQHGGQACGRNREERECNTQGCPVDCLVSPFAMWGACSRSCGGGAQQRQTPVLRYAANGGKACPTGGPTRACNTNPCPVDCRVGGWGSWGPCSKPGLGGEQVRNRTVVTHPAHGGAQCPELHQKQECNIDAFGEDALRPVESAYAFRGNPGAAMGGTDPEQLLAQESHRAAFLMFQVPRNMNALRALLRLHVTRWDSGVRELRVRSVIAERLWSENTLNWYNQPSVGGVLCALRGRPVWNGQGATGGVLCDLTSHFLGAEPGSLLSFRVEAVGGGLVSFRSHRVRDRMVQPKMMLTKPEDPNFGLYLHSEQDTWVHDGSLVHTVGPTRFSGVLLVRNRGSGGQGEALFQFRVPQAAKLSKKPIKATLIVFERKWHAKASDGRPLPLRVALTSDGWNREGTKWASRPRAGSVVCTADRMPGLQVQGHNALRCDVTVASHWQPGAVVNLVMTSEHHGESDAQIFSSEAENYLLRPAVRLEFK